MHKQTENRPIGGIDSDSENRLLAPEDYRYALNISNSVGYENQFGVVTNIKGNVLIDNYTLPSGINKCIGSYFDRGENTTIYFVYNSAGQHKILRFYPSKTSNSYPYGTIEEIITFDFGWSDEEHITGVELVDGKLLYWTDSVKPRMINVVKANNTEKKKSWKVYLPKNYVQPFQSWGWNIYDMNGNQVFAGTFSFASDLTREQAFEQIASDINASQNFVTAESCGCDLNVTEVGVNQVYFDFAGNSNYKVVADNWYGLNLIDRYFDQCKWQPRCKPIPLYKSDPKRKFNFVKVLTPKFRISYTYDNGEISTLSPISDIATNNISCSKKSFQSLNYIDVNFNSDDLLDANNFTIIKRVGFYVQETEDAQWRLIQQIDICDFYDGTECSFRFYGNEQTSAIDDITATKPYDNVPRKSNALSFVKNRIVQANVLEGYDSPQCIDAEFSATFDEDENREFFKVTGRVYIVNGSLFDGVGLNFANSPRYIEPSLANSTGAIFFDESISEFPLWGGMIRLGNKQYINDELPDEKITSGFSPLKVAEAMRQYLPEGGFVPYSAGTPFYTISKQKKLGLGLSQTANGVCDITQEGAGTFAADVFLNKIFENYSEFELLLPKGRHVIRLASHWCSYGDKAAKGSLFDLNNGLGFQKTSTNVRGVKDDNGVYYPFQELVIDVQSDMFAGSFYVEDMVQTVYTLPAGGGTQAWDSAITGYLYDNKGSTDLFSLQQGVPVELAATFNLPLGGGTESGIMRFEPYPSSSKNATTDHNGYFYCKFGSFREKTPAEFSAGFATEQENFTVTASTLGLAINDFVTLRNQTGTTIYGCSNNTDSEAALQTLLNGNITSVYDYTPFKYTIGLPPFNEFYGGFFYADIVAAVTNTDARDTCSTVVEGYVKDTSGNPIDDVPAIYTKGAVSRTDGNGFYRFVAWSSIFEQYGNFWRQRNLDSIVFNSGGACFYEYITSSRVVLSITQFAQNTTATPPPYSPTAKYIVQDTIANIIQSLITQAPKRGGTYDIAIRFYDESGRYCSVVPISTLNIPYFSEDISLYFDNYPLNTYLFGRPIITFDLSNSEPPPTWAATYQFMRTKYRQTYLQWCANKVTYLAQTAFDEDDIQLPEQPTGYSAFNATHIKISLSNIVDYYRNNNKSTVTYEFAEGDRVRLIKNRSAEYFEGGIFEFEVANYEQSTQSIILLNNLSAPEIQSGDLIEITTTENIFDGDEKLYYEFGKVYKCTAPNQQNNNYSVISDTFDSWDTYWRSRLIPVFDDATKFFGNILTIVEDASVSDFYTSKADNIGRSGFIDDKLRETLFSSKIVSSNQILFGTDENGLSSYDAVNFTELSVSYGDINRLIFTNNILLSISERKVTSVYIGQQILTDSTQGDVVLSVSQSFFGNNRPLMQDWGTQHPESIFVWNGYVYGADQKMQVIWRYAADGLNAISDYKAKSLFKAELVGRTSIIGQFDEYKNEAVFTLIGGSPAKTIAYFEPKNRWTTFYSFIPEAYGQSGNNIVSFVSGRLWLHDRNTTYNNFYGVQSQSELWYIINAENIAPKVWQAMYLEILNATNTNNWTLYELSNDNGQLSRIEKSSFVKKEAYWHSSFKRDLNTLGVTNPIVNGRAMRSNMLVVKMSNDGTGLETLKGIVTAYQVSERITF